LPIYIGRILPIPNIGNIVISGNIYRCANTSVKLYTKRLQLKQKQLQNSSFLCFN